MCRRRSYSLQVELNAKQSDFWRSTSRVDAFIGGWGCGKSTVARLKLLQKHLSIPRVECWACMTTYRQLEDSLIPDFFHALPPLAQFYTKSDMACSLPNHSVLKFRYLEDPEKVTNVTLRAAWVEQAEMVPEESVIRLLGRLRQHAQGQLLLTANTAGQNWLYRWLKAGECPMPFHLVEGVTADNQQHLPPAYLASLEALRQTRPSVYNRYVLNSWAATEGAVWPEFSEAAHVIAPFPIPPTWRQGMALDHGYRNPTAVLWWACSEDGVVYLVDEHYEAGQVVEYHAGQILRRPRHTFQDAVADPACWARTQQDGQSLVSVADRYLHAGIPLRPAQRKNDADLLSVVGGYFARHEIKIFANCVQLIREVRDYQWAVVKQTYLDKHGPPERARDVNNHLCDCLGYVIAERPAPATRSQGQRILDHLRELGDYESPPRDTTVAGIAGLP